MRKSDLEIFANSERETVIERGLRDYGYNMGGLDDKADALCKICGVSYLPGDWDRGICEDCEEDEGRGTVLR